MTATGETGTARDLPYTFEVQPPAPVSASPGATPDADEEASGPESYVLRPLQSGDFQKGYKELLSQLTDVGDLEEDSFEEVLKRMQRSQAEDECNSIRTVVVERLFPDGKPGKLVAAASLLMEQKFSRGGKRCGHIEDVVTDAGHRKRGLARMILDQLVAEAGNPTSKRGACYKVILDCTEANSAVYAKCGYSKTGEIQMRMNV